VALAGFQRSYLKALAHKLRPIVMVGDDGVTPEVNKAVAQALLDHELVKIRMQEPEDKKAMAQALAEGARRRAHRSHRPHGESSTSATRKSPLHVPARQPG